MSISKCKELAHPFLLKSNESFWMEGMSRHLQLEKLTLKSEPVCRFVFLNVGTD